MKKHYDTTVLPLYFFRTESPATTCSTLILNKSTSHRYYIGPKYPQPLFVSTENSSHIPYKYINRLIVSLRPINSCEHPHSHSLLS